MKNMKGFTLIELVIVFAIIAIITAIAVPKFSNIMDSRKEKACIATREIVVEYYNIQKSIDESITLETLLDNPTEYFNEEVRCPSGGEYIVTNGAIICSAHDDFIVDEEEDDSDNEEEDEDNKYSAWKSDVNYGNHAIVTHNGEYYERKNAFLYYFNSDIVPGENHSPWEKIYDWNESTIYWSNDVIKHNGKFYRANLLNLKREPGVSGRWDEI